MANFNNKIEFTDEEMNTIKNALKIFEELFKMAEKNHFTQYDDVFDMRNFDYPSEIEDLYELLYHQFIMQKKGERCRKHLFLTARWRAPSRRFLSRGNFAQFFN